MQTTEKVLELYKKVLAELESEDVSAELLGELAAAVLECEADDLWDIGEFEVVGLENLVSGAWHALADCHSGQWSKEYAAFCAFDRIYSPAWSETSETLEESDSIAYEMICASLGCPVEKTS